MTFDFYGTSDAVLTRTGIQPTDLGLDDDDALESFVEEVLTQTTDLFDRVMGKSYLEDDAIPAGLDAIADDATADVVRQMVVSRQTPVVRIDDFAVRTIQTTVLSKDVRDRLKFYGSGNGAQVLELPEEFIAPIMRPGSWQFDDEMP